VLGVPEGASAEDIKNAWRDLAKVWHPDRFQHDPRLKDKAGENLKRINEAYESLHSYDPAVRPRVGARIRESVSMILGMGELGEPPRDSGAQAAPVPLVPRGPIGIRRSLRVLGLGTHRATGEIELERSPMRRRWPLVVAIVVLVLLVLAALALVLLKHPEGT